MKMEKNGHSSKWAWHRRVLLSLRDQLLKERAQRLNEASEPLESHSLNLADSATDEFDHSFALSRLSAGQDVLYEVEEALKRIENGTYGFCAETGKPIPASRLRAVPWTRFGKEVELRLERTRDIKLPHLGELESVNGDRFTIARSSQGNRTPPANDESLELIPRRSSAKPNLK